MVSILHHYHSWTFGVSLQQICQYLFHLMKSHPINHRMSYAQQLLKARPAHLVLLRSLMSTLHDFNNYFAQYNNN